MLIINYLYRDRTAGEADLKNIASRGLRISPMREFARRFGLKMELVIKQRDGTQRTVLYDERDHELISCRKWHVSNKGYVTSKCSINRDGRRGVVLMHRLVLGLYNDAVVVDHKNHNTLDNRRCNLRACTRSQNQKNKRPAGKSKYLGVYYFITKSNGRSYGPYIRAQITVSGKKIALGRFPTEVAAARAYDMAAKIHHGEFANLNFPNE